ncbi:MAG: extracellular solute-binding protein [Clostridia bacterium]|nr:extracellular solute-binding protein [Clostridia bacterium]
MNKTFIKVLALVLTFALVVPFVVSCGDPAPQQVTRPGTEGGATTDVETGVDSTGEVKIQPKIPEGITFNDDGTPYKFRILSYDPGNEWSVRDMGAEEINEDPINDSVFNRNKYVEDLLKIEIVEIPAANASDLAKKSVAAGLDEYDLIVVPTASTASLAQNGYLYRLDELEYLDPTQPWWDTNSYESLSIANAHYMIVGDIQIMDKDATWVQFFNKKMIEDYALENPFDLVKNNEWTIEKQVEMIKQVTDDTNGDGLYTKDDTFGMVSTTFSPMGFFYGFGEQIATKNADDIPELSMNSPKISQIVNYADQLCSINSKIAFAGQPADVQEIFEQGRGLFMGEVLQLAERLREMDTDFGLIPYPKFDKDQENYYSVVHPTTCVVSVPLTISDEERTGIILEALCAESKYTLRKAYYDTSLTTKFLRYDDGSSEMLDLIFNNRVYDLGIINDWGGYYSGFVALFTSGSTDFASMYAKNESRAIKAIDQVVERYLEAE